MTKGLASLLVTLVALSLLLAAPELAPAQSAENELAFKVAKGRVTYRIYCQNCHGTTGMGDGRISELLKVQPADLTLMSANNNGSFPAERAHQVIDGRTEVKGHGSREMPIWGDAFLKTLQPTYSELTDEERAVEKIDELVLFLKTIQRVEG
jgi:mono/diheme cytochrome c family protein